MSKAFDLRRFAPADIRFTLRDGTECVVGDPDVDDVAVMLRIEEQIKTNEDTDEALLEGKQLLLRLIREKTPEVEAIKISPRDLLTVFALIVHGDSVAAAVAEAISGASDDEETPERPEADDPAADDPEGVQTAGTVTPLPSQKGSSEPSSSSGGRDAGDLATGTA